jgi:hypothetical protein
MAGVVDVVYVNTVHNLIFGVLKGGMTSKGWAVVNRPRARVDG